MTNATITLDHLSPSQLLATAVHASMSIDHLLMLMDVHLANQLPISESIVLKCQAAIDCRRDACDMLIGLGLFDQYMDAKKQMVELYKSSEVEEPSDVELESVVVEQVAA